jgi:hypothetical protein
MQTGIIAGAAAAKKVKDESPDFDPRDQKTISDEVDRMTFAAFQAASENISRFEIISVKNAIPGINLTNEQAESMIKAYFTAAMSEAQ